MASKLVRVASRRFQTVPNHRKGISSVACRSTASFSHHFDNSANESSASLLARLAVMGGLVVATATSLTNPAFSQCEAEPATSHPHFTPSQVAKEEYPTGDEYEDKLDNFPIFTSEQVAENDGTDGKPIWMTYGGVVYDVTDFIANHPGGSEKILLAAGSSIEPYWHIYQQHFSSDLPTRLMEHMVIGRLAEEDQERIDEQMEVMYETSDDPFAHEPVRHKALRVHSERSMNAETPFMLLTNHYLTPNSLFYIRHHHPVPFLTTSQINDFNLVIDLSAYGKGEMKISLEDLKKLPKSSVTTTLQCNGNRRSGFNKYQRTSGTTWGQGAISTAQWSGVKLSTLLELAGIDDPVKAQEEGGLEHVRFYSLDGLMASIGIEKAMSPYGDCLIAYEMNGDILPRDHGYPLRVIVPGYGGIRNVKWVNKIEVAKEEAEGPWQRGLNYKILPPGVTDATNVRIEDMPSMNESSLYSGITEITAGSFAKNAQPGDRVMMKVKGWAWAGGGRKIVRVDITGDDAKSWTSAELLEGNTQRPGRAWAWTFWECEVPALVKEDMSVEVACKAIDSSFNVQPESCDHMWNVRGLGNNSWFRMSHRLHG
eukprot:Nitzschia sp. Nitz4//scaffold320_size20398//10095//12176//NITZ4_008677-RA/size20398-augustus-gene-0.2-mRNA-1//1//CDS//3329547756//3532//frame0